MNIVTLTTDFGRKDYYVGAIKGKILSQGFPITFVDITHEIENYNILQAAFVLKHAFRNFPPNSIHLTSVNNFYAKTRKYLVLYTEGHYFVGPDNGIFSLLFDKVPSTIYEINAKDVPEGLLDVKDIFAKVVGHILNKSPLHEIGSPLKQYLQRLSLQPIIGKDQIRGSVRHIDNYQNVILNIDKTLFERVSQQRAFELYFKRHDPIISISKNYTEASVGEALCLFNASNFLEIAVNMGKAAELFGLQVDDHIQIDFLDTPL